MKTNDKILKDALVKNNVLSAAEATSLQQEATTSGIPFKEILIEKSIVNERQILIALSQYLSVATIDLAGAVIDKTVIDQVPVKFVWYYKFMPTRIEAGVLTFATAHPMDVRTVDEIRLHLGLKLEMRLCLESELNEALRRYYGFASETIDRMMAKEAKEPAKVRSSQDTESLVEDLERQSEDPTVSNLVNQIILEAYKKRATDIHIEPYRNKVRFRYRIDGVLVDANLPADVKHFLPAILSRIKILANISITEKRLPQDGSAVVKTKEQQVDLRVSTIPTPRGESMVIRILPSKVMLLSLEKLGFNKTTVEKFRYLIRKPHGIIFITGPTGSGKTTSLYACLNEINSAERKIITIEDPVEYEMDGITQVQVNPKVSFSFSAGLRSLLRHDPDIIMVGEVRDLETAEIAIRTALTGHLVFSTLHTNDSASGITRLIDMGVEPYLVASSVEAFVAQRLIRLICPKCKQEDTSSMEGVKEEIASSLKLPSVETVRLYRGVGCDHCNNTGYYGRMAIYEILLMSDEIRSAVLEKPRSDYIKMLAMKTGLVTLRQNGWQAVLDGFTTVEEVINVSVKDEEIEVEQEQEKPQKIESVAIVPPPVFKEDERVEKIKHSAESKNDYDSRIYTRAYTPVGFCYRLSRRDPNDATRMVSDPVEHAAITEDISAGGIRFVSKTLFAVGTLFDLRIYLSEGANPIACLAKICRVDEDSLSNLYTIVVYYLDITAADRALINKFAEQAAAQVQKQDSTVRTS